MPALQQAVSVVRNFMKAPYFFICILTLLLFSFRENIRNKFSVEVWYESNLTPGIKYLLNQNEIKVLTSSDFRWRSSTLVYSKKLSARQSDSIYESLIKLRLDTLKSGYQNLSIYDGLYTHYAIKRDKVKRMKTTTYATSTIATDSFIEIIKSKLLTEKYYPMNLLQ